MTPRSLAGYALLGIAPFLVTLWLLGVGGKPSRFAAPPAFDARELSRPDPAQEARPASAPVASDDSDESATSRARRDAQYATDPDIRMHALQALGETPANDDLEVLLAASVGNDAHDRAAAVTALRRRLQHGSRDPRIWSALQGAAADSDPLVVVMAQSALEGFDQQ